MWEGKNSTVNNSPPAVAPSPFEALAGSDPFFAVLYDELRSCASRHLRHESKDQSLRTTALVHETYCRLADQRLTSWKSRGHFMAVAATSMRRIIVDYARARLADKRGAGWEQLGVDLDTLVPEERSDEILALDDALRELSALDERLATLVELRFFGGYSMDETAEALRSSPATVRREWSLARAWLNRRLGAGVDR